MTTRTSLRSVAITCVIVTSMCVTVSAFAADSTEVIQAKLKSRDQTIHLLDDWMRDPFITRGPDGLFYLSCTRLDRLPDKKQGLEIWTSKDLVEWKNLGVPWSTEDSSWLKPVIEGAKSRPDGKGYLLWAARSGF